MQKYDTYYMMLTPEQKRKVIDIARCVPGMIIGRAAWLFTNLHGDEAAIKRYLFVYYGVQYGGDSI